MGKIKVKITLNNETNIYPAIKKDNVVQYKDKECLVNINLDTFIIQRKNRNYEVHLQFIENKLTSNPYELRRQGTMSLDIYTEKIIRGAKYLKIKYKVIGGEEINFEMEELE